MNNKLDQNISARQKKVEKRTQITSKNKGQQTNTNQKSDSQTKVQCSQREVVMHQTVKHNRHM